MPGPAAGDGHRGRGAAAGGDRGRPADDGPAGEPGLFRGEARPGDFGPGGPGRLPQHHRATDGGGASDLRPADPGLLQRQGRGEERHRPPLPLPPRQPLPGGEDQERHPGRGHHRGHGVPGAGGHPAAHAAGPGQEPPDLTEDHLLPQLQQDPAGEPHHPAGRPLRGAGEGGVQGGHARPHPRHLLLRGHGLRGAHGGGAGQQRAHRAPGQGEEGNPAHPGPALRRRRRPQGRHRLGLRRPGAAGLHLRPGRALLPDGGHPAGDPEGRQREPAAGEASPAGPGPGRAHRHPAGGDL